MGPEPSPPGRFPSDVKKRFRPSIKTSFGGILVGTKASCKPIDSWKPWGAKELYPVDIIIVNYPQLHD